MRSAAGCAIGAPAWSLKVEIVDAEERIQALLDLIEMIGSGLVTLKKARVLRYGERQSWSRRRDRIRGAGRRA
ncbi:MAG TPA: hypothetical protein VLE23_12745 [Geminicoccaceae bacterium]|nr:hypothetical protein [Geminicoccaceae bacterium]